MNKSRGHIHVREKGCEVPKIGYSHGLVGVERYVELAHGLHYHQMVVAFERIAAH